MQFICLKTKRGQQQSQAAACDQSPRFLLVYLLHISENDSFPSAIYTAVIISIVMRETAACLQLFITYRNKVWFCFFFLLQDVCCNCDNWYFHYVGSRIVGLKFGILKVKTALY